MTIIKASRCGVGGGEGGGACRLDKPHHVVSPMCSVTKLYKALSSFDKGFSYDFSESECPNKSNKATKHNFAGRCLLS